MQRTYGPIDNDLSAFRQRLVAEAPVVGDPRIVGLETAYAQRKAQNAWLHGDPPLMAEATTRAVPTRSGPIMAKVLRPPQAAAQAAPVLLYLHGGGFVFGDLDTHDRLARVLAQETGAVVVLLDYRRAPAHPYPAALEDTIDAFGWLNANAAELGVDPARAGIIGDSAGGNLALAAGRALTDADSWPPRCLGLVYPMASLDRETLSHQHYGGGDFGLTTDMVAWFWSLYLTGPRAHSDPLAVPGLAALTNLPPIALFIAECDPLADDSWTLAERLAEARHPHSLDVFKGMTHAFIQYDAHFPPAAWALQTIGARMRALLG